MPQMPGVADVHINAPLTNVSVAYIQDARDFIADKVFPRLPVNKKSDIYYIHSKSDWRRTDVQKRAPGTESAGIGWNLTTSTYYADVFAVHKDIDDQTRANSDSIFKQDSIGTRLVTNQMMLKRDVDWASKYFQTGVWNVEYTGVASAPTGTQFLGWDQAGSDPLSNFTKWKSGFKLSTGFKPSFMVVGSDVWVSLQNHAAILDRIKYTQKGVVTEDLVAEFFGVKHFMVSDASVATGPQISDAVAQDAAATYSYINNSKSVLFGYAPDQPSLETPSAGYTFAWKGYQGNDEAVRIKKFRMEHLEVDRIEGSMAYDQHVVSKDCAVFLNTVVS